MNYLDLALVVLLTVANIGSWLATREQAKAQKEMNAILKRLLRENRGY